MSNLVVVVANVAALSAAEDVTVDVAEVAADTSAAVLTSPDDEDLLAKVAAADVAVVGPSVSALALGTALRGVATPLVLLGNSQAGSWENYGVCGATTQSSQTEAKIPGSAVGSPLVAGLPAGNFPLYNAPATMRHTDTPTVGSQVLATMGTNSARAVFFKVPAGTALLGGGAAAEVRYALTGHAAGVEASGTPAKWRDLLAAAVSEAAPDAVVQPAPSVTITPPPGLVVGEPYQLEVTVDLNGGTPVASVAWSFPAGLTADSSVTEDPEVTAAGEGSYPVSVVVTNTAGKTGTTSLTLQASSVEVPAEDNLAMWDGTAFVPVLGVSLDLGDGTWLNLDTGNVFSDPEVEYPDGPPPDPDPDPTRWGVVVADDGAGAAAPNNSDNWVKARLESLGYTAEFVADIATTPAGVDALFIAATANSVDSLTHESFAGPIFTTNGPGWTGYGLNAGSVPSTTTATGHVVNDTHPVAVAAGLTAGAVTLLTTATGTRAGTGLAGTALVDLASTGGQHVVSVLDAGQNDAEGNPVPARRVMTGWSATAYYSGGDALFTAAGLALFDALAEWVTA